jgi:WD40 repeat protein
MSNVKSKQARIQQSRKIATGFKVGIIVMTAIATLAIIQWQRAEQESNIALARQLVAQAQSTILSEDASQETALLLATLSMRLTPSGEAAQILQNDVSIHPKSRTENDGYIITYAFSPDGKYVASGSEKHVIRVWEISTGDEIAILPRDDFGTASLAFCVDRRYLVSGGTGSGSKGGIVHVWEITTGKEIARMTHRRFGVSSVDISPDCNYVVFGTYDGVVHLWDISADREIAALIHPDVHTVNALAFSLDGRYVVSGTREDYAAHVWNLSTGEEIARVAHDDYVTSVAFSPDGKYIVAGSSGQGHSIRVWKVATQREISHMIHTYSVNSVAFSPDGRYVISGSEDLTVRVWEANTGKEVSRIAGVNVRNVAFSPDGTYGIAGDYFENIHVWKWRPEDIIADACSRLARNLTRVEWQMYIGSALRYQPVCNNLPIEPVPTAVIITLPTPYSTTTH